MKNSMSYLSLMLLMYIVRLLNVVSSHILLLRKLLKVHLLNMYIKEEGIPSFLCLLPWYCISPTHHAPLVS